MKTEGRKPKAQSGKRNGFTLVELMIVIMIIGLLFTALMGAMYSAVETAKRARTQQVISKLHNQMMTKWEPYQTRRLPVNFVANSLPPGDLTQRLPPSKGSGTQSALIMAGKRLGALRELMRMELPDAYSDIQLAGSSNLQYLLLGTTGYMPRASQVFQNYIASSPTRLTPPQATSSNWSSRINIANQSNAWSECLYMLITLTPEDRDATGASMSVQETSDTDMDGMKEIADGWGNPIFWCRWPGAMGAPNGSISGLISDLQAIYTVPRGASPPDPRVRLGGTPQMSDPRNSGNILTRDPPANHDPFDPLQVDRWEPNSQGPWSNLPEMGYTLFPLIMSGGPDFSPSLVGSGADDGFMVGLTSNTAPVGSSQPFNYQNRGCPYYGAGSSNQNGSILSPSAYNNIHNHTVGTLR